MPIRQICQAIFGAGPKLLLYVKRPGSEHCCPGHTGLAAIRGWGPGRIFTILSYHRYDIYTLLLAIIHALSNNYLLSPISPNTYSAI